MRGYSLSFCLSGGGSRLTGCGWLSLLIEIDHLVGWFRLRIGCVLLDKNVAWLVIVVSWFYYYLG